MYDLDTIIDAVMQRLAERVMPQFGADIQRRIEEEVRDTVRKLDNARGATVATTAQLGASPFSTRAGPNGTQQVAKVWLSADRTAPVSLPVRPGVTLAEGASVRVEYNSPGVINSAWIDGPV